MALILSLETSTDICSVALHRDGTLINEIIVDQPQAHASRLAPLIRDLVTQSSSRVSDLSAVAISSGPGSYTGLRIGTSTAKGICFTLEIPLIAVGTLEVMAARAVNQVHEKEAFLCPMIDARRMEVYCQLFNTKLEPVSGMEAKIIDESSFQELLNTHKMFFFGNGAAKCRSMLNSDNARYLDGIQPHASQLGALAGVKFVNRDFQDVSAFEPQYLKQFEVKKAKSIF